jgi:hypothetical protein
LFDKIETIKLMKNNNEIVQILEEEINKVNTKILLLYFPSNDFLNKLFTPRLENISFVKINNCLTVNLKNQSFREYFNDWIIRFSEKISQYDSIEQVIEKFNAEIRALILIGQKEKKILWQSARGLYGEFLALKKMLVEQKYSQPRILEGWHRPEPATHDFDLPEFTLEVKTVSRESTTVKISSLNQLEAIDNKPLILNIIRIEKIDKSKSDSLGDLFNEIKTLLYHENVILFEIKCAEDAFLKYLGPELMPLDYKFYVIEETYYNVDQQNFPRVQKKYLNPAISKISYSVDVSSFASFKINTYGE